MTSTAHGKIVDVDRAIADVAQIIDEGRRDDALGIMRAMLEAVLRRNAELELDVMRLLKKHLGKTSERTTQEQLAFLFSLLPKEDVPPDVPLAPAAAEGLGAQGDAPKHKKRSKHGRGALPDTLRREETIIPAPDDERVCSKCGKDKTVIGHECSEVLHFKPAELWVERQMREKLACDERCEQGVVTAPAPEKVIERGRPAADLLAQIVVSKYADHQPLTRQQKMIERLGVRIPVSTMADWVGATAGALEPIADLIRRLVLEGYVLQADDTGLKVLDDAAPGGAKRGHLWFYVADATLCAVVYTPDWTKEGPGLFLTARKGGYLVADAYKGFDHIFTREDDPPIECGCWGHGRRPFVELAEQGEARAAVLLHHVRKLYDVERAANEARDGPAERLARRQAESRPITEEIERWWRKVLASEPPQSSLAKAAGYLRNQWRALTRFLEDGALPLDNTLVERCLRGVGVGRRNYLFAGSDQGALRAATLYTLIATCRLCGVEPLAYITDVLTKIQTGRWPHGRLRELLPDVWRQTAPASALVPSAR